MGILFKSTLPIIIAISIGIWFSGEYTRKLDAEYLIGDMRNEFQRATTLMAGLVSVGVTVKDVQDIDATIKQYVLNWPELTYIHIQDDSGNLLTEWKRKPIPFGEGILKFEQPITYGNEQFGIFSLYVDLNNYYRLMNEHIDDARRRAALILLSITLFVVFISNREFNL